MIHTLFDKKFTSEIFWIFSKLQKFPKNNLKNWIYFDGVILVWIWGFKVLQTEERI